jgi:hypothetical protein
MAHRQMEIASSRALLARAAFFPGAAEARAAFRSDHGEDRGVTVAPARVARSGTGFCDSRFGKRGARAKKSRAPCDLSDRLNTLLSAAGAFCR